MPPLPHEIQKKKPIEIANWTLMYISDHEPINLYEFANAAYEMGFTDAERIAEQKENEERRVAAIGRFPFPVPVPFLVSAEPECALTARFPKHIPGVLEGCTCTG